MTTKEILLLALVILNVLDIYTTIRILRHGGSEVNPIMSWLMDKLGVMPALIVPKTLLLLAVWFYLAIMPTIVLAGLCCLYAAVILHNYKELKR